MMDSRPENIWVSFLESSSVGTEMTTSEPSSLTLEVTGAGVTVTARTGALVGGASRYSGQERGGRSS